MDRRNFLKGLGLIGGIAVAPATVAAISKLETKDENLENELNSNSNSITFHANYDPREAMRLDSNGNLGLGVVTPSNWNSGNNKIEVMMKPGPDGNLYVKEK